MKIKPEKEERVVKLFGSVSRARILGFLYANEGQPFYQREIMFETGLSLRPVQRELANLVDDECQHIVRRKECHDIVQSKL